MSLHAHFAFYRSLYSQSAASVTVGMTAAAVRAGGRAATLTLLEKGEHRNASRLLARAPDDAVLLVKPNFQDAAESLWLADELAATGVYRGVFLLGIYAAGNAEELLGLLPHVDGIVEGEPEATVPALLAAVEDGGTWRTAPPPGLAVRAAAGGVLRGPALPPTIDFDGTLRPVRDIEAQESARVANLEAGRGCTAMCTFCHVPVVDIAVGAPKRRTKEPAAVVAEVEELVALGKRYIVFNDPVFWSGPRDTERVAAMARLLRKLDRELYFMAYLRTRPFPDEELLGLLAEAGMVRAFIGVESGWTPTLKIYRKGTARDEYADVKERLERHGISHHIGFLIFNPFSSFAQVRHDLDYLAGHGQLHRLGVILERARLVPRTGLRAEAEQRGLLRLPPDPLTGDSAYSYVFADPRVGLAHRCLEQAMRRDFGGRQKYLEYHHTGTEFLRYLLARRCTALGIPVPTPWWEPMRRAHAALSAVVADYGRRLLDAAEAVDPADAEAAVAAGREEVALAVHRAADTAGFVHALVRLERATEVAAAVLLRRVRAAGHGGLVESLFTSAEGTD